MDLQAHYLGFLGKLVSQRTETRVKLALETISYLESNKYLR